MPRTLALSVACLGFAVASARAQAPYAPPALAIAQPTPIARVDTLTLLDVLTRVRDAHPLVRAAAARTDAARGSRRTAGAFTNPVLQYQVENAPIESGASVAMDREVMTTAMIPLEALYQRGPRVTRADADVRATQADARAEGIRLALEAARSYYRTSIAQVTVDATRDVAGWLDSVVTYNRARAKEGIVAEADLIRAQLEEDRVAAELSMQEADLARERATLFSYIGPQPAVVSLVVAVANRPIDWRMPAVDEAAIRGAVERTPQVQAGRERVSSATAGVSVERRMVIRDVSAVLGTKQTAGTTSLIAGMSIPLPLFTQNRGEIARATAEQRVAEFELAAMERSGSAELKGSFDAATVLLKRATALSAPQSGGPESIPALLARADESRRIALGAYREGAVPLLTVLDAARSWAEVRITFYRAMLAQHESVLALAAALGVAPDQVLSSTAPLLQVPR